MNDAIAKLPWTDRQWDLVQQAVREGAERTRIPAKSLRAAKADPTDVAVPEYALRTAPLPLAPNPSLDSALAGLIAQPRRPDVNSDPTLYLTTLSKLVYLRNREVADGDLEAALTYFRRAGAQIAQAENALLLNGRGPGGGPANAGPIPGAPPGVIVNALPRPVPGLCAPLGVPRRFMPPIVPIPMPTFPAITAAGSFAAAFAGAVTGAVSAATAQLESYAYHAPYAMVASTPLWTAINQPAAMSLIPARPAIERILQGGPLMYSALLPAPFAIVLAHDCPELEQMLAREIKVKFLHASEEPRFVFRVSVRTALRVRDRRAITVIV
ncbi:MAG TPA: encapsulin [Polyangiaceae bacterium]